MESTPDMAHLADSRLSLPTSSQKFAALLLTEQRRRKDGHKMLYNQRHCCLMDLETAAAEVAFYTHSQGYPIQESFFKIEKSKQPDMKAVPPKVFPQ
jgi:hypothetical protein